MTDTDRTYKDPITQKITGTLANARGTAPGRTDDPTNPARKQYVKTGSHLYKPDYNGLQPLPAFAGCDIVTMLSIEGKIYPVHNITTLSIDVNRGITPIPTFGSIRVNRFTRGHRMIAGTLALLTTVAGPMPLIGPNTVTPTFGSTYTPSSYLTGISASSGLSLDQLPPFDIIISYMDEYGRMGFERLYGVVIYKEAKVTSINDLVTEVQCQYFALDRDPQVASENMHTYYGGGNDAIAENIVVLNNMTALKMIRDRLADAKSQGTYPVVAHPITSRELGTIGSSVTLSTEKEVTAAIEEYDAAISTILQYYLSSGYIQSDIYTPGFREYLSNSNLLPNT